MKAAFQLFPTEAIGYRGRIYADPPRKWDFREMFGQNYPAPCFGTGNDSLRARDPTVCVLYA